MTSGLDLYLHQHADLLRAAKALESDLDGGWRPGGAEVARGHLLHLSGKLTVHLQMEDRSLYPELLGSADPAVRAVAARFQDSMGGLKAVAAQFFHRWLGNGSIDADPAAFSLDARAVLGALAERIAAEDAQLYPLVEPKV